jgi:nucleotide-binding universal stress UspA family protein
MKILLPVDGSEPSLRAARHVVVMLAGCGEHEIHLLNVQPPVDAPEIRSHMTASEIEAMQQTRGGDALEAVRKVLNDAGQTYTPAVMLGPVAETIAKAATDLGCDKIVMGTRGLGSLGNALMGSVTTHVLQLTQLPVTLVK